MVIVEEGDDEQMLATHNSQASAHEENIHTEVGQEHSIEINPQGNQHFLKKKISIRHQTNVSNLSNERPHM